jgi:hypothetical protein
MLLVLLVGIVYLFGLGSARRRAQIEANERQSTGEIESV